LGLLIKLFLTYPISSGIKTPSPSYIHFSNALTPFTIFDPSIKAFLPHSPLYGTNLITNRASNTTH
jgi:hypothetical protein